MSRIVAAIVLMFLASAARAQTFYQPVQYQYRGENGAIFYYGGSNPAVFDFARRFDGQRGFYNPDIAQVRVYVDQLPYQNAALYGYSPVDAYNDAQRNAPRYFRKADLLSGAEEQSATITPRSSGAILIIPRKPFKPAPASDKLLVMRRSASIGR